jgi:signal peptidase
MSPHINRGDLVFYTDISRVGDITTNDKKSSMSFEDYGDVIIYKPYGQDGVVPYVHRAMYYIEQGDEMWPGGPKTLYAGYITKGDNMNTNSQYDQQLSISDETPIKREWVVGIARFRIPYIGYIRLLLP